MEETSLQSSGENQETAEEPAQSPPVERVTEKVKDLRKVVAGRAGAAARKVKQEERFLEQIAYQARLRRAHEEGLHGRHAEEFPKIPPHLEKDVVVVEGPLADADLVFRARGLPDR